MLRDLESACEAGIYTRGRGSRGGVGFLDDVWEDISSADTVWDFESLRDMVFFGLVFDSGCELFGIVHYDRAFVTLLSKLSQMYIGPTWTLSIQA